MTMLDNPQTPWRPAPLSLRIWLAPVLALLVVALLQGQPVFGIGPADIKAWSLHGAHKLLVFLGGDYLLWAMPGMLWLYLFARDQERQLQALGVAIKQQQLPPAQLQDPALWQYLVRREWWLIRIGNCASALMFCWLCVGVLSLGAAVWADEVFMAWGYFVVFGLLGCLSTLAAPTAKTVRMVLAQAREAYTAKNPAVEED